MATRATVATKEYLKSVSLPEQTDSYTTISHGFIIDNTLARLAEKNFEIKSEVYRTNKQGDVAQGVYHLNYGNDPEMGMMFAWSNSYDKSMRFKCAIGGYVFACMNGVISGDMGSWARRHSGTADTETLEMITSQIENANFYYDQLVKDKSVMKNIIMTKRQQAELIGRVYFEYNMITSEQLSVVKAESKRPSFDYNTDKDSMWQLYNNITLSLQRSHPRTWMDQQRMVHWLVNKEYLPKPVAQEPTNQIDLIDMIKDVESEQLN